MIPKKFFPLLLLLPGLLLALGPSFMPVQAQAFLAVFFSVILFWLFSSIPLFATGILGVSICVILGLVPLQAAFSPFADPIIFMFLGSFLLAKALEKSKLDLVLAERALGSTWVQQSPQRIILVFFGLSYFLSMWISNTATVVMLLPLSWGVIRKIEAQLPAKSPALTETLLLGLAYSATIGGSATPIGSPPNMIAMGFIKNLLGISLSFVDWMLIGTPVSLAFFYWIYRRTIKKLSLPANPKGPVLSQSPSPLHPLSTTQKRVLALFSLTLIFWLLPGVLSFFVSDSSSLHSFLNQNLSAAAISIFFAILLFVIPDEERKSLLHTTHLNEIDWGSLLLFGAGLSLGNMLFETGLAHQIATQVGNLSSGWGLAWVAAAFIVFTLFFTELASNTATANVLIPILIATSQQMGQSSAEAVILCAIACNSAFMLPISTPPNTIVYGTGRIKKWRMVQTGFSLNLFAAISLAFLAFLLIQVFPSSIF